MTNCLCSQKPKRKEKQPKIKIEFEREKGLFFFFFPKLRTNDKRFYINIDLTQTQGKKIGYLFIFSYFFLFFPPSIILFFHVHNKRKKYLEIIREKRINKKRRAKIYNRK